MTEKKHPIKEYLLKQMEGKAQPAPVQKVLGFKIKEIGDGQVILSAHVDKRFHNPMGTVHGGILTAYADVAMGMAFSTLLEEGESTTTVEAKTNFIRPLVEDDILIRARVTYKGNTMGLVESGVRDKEFQLITKSTGTFLILRGKRAKGREYDVSRKE